MVRHEPGEACLRALETACGLSTTAAGRRVLWGLVQGTLRSSVSLSPTSRAVWVRSCLQSAYEAAAAASARVTNRWHWLQGCLRFAEERYRREAS